jgi:hypothetical protein
MRAYRIIFVRTNHDELHIESNSMSASCIWFFNEPKISSREIVRWSTRLTESRSSIRPWSYPDIAARKSTAVTFCVVTYQMTAVWGTFGLTYLKAMDPFPTFTSLSAHVKHPEENAVVSISGSQS